MGINIFDTAEVYGNEQSESVLDKYYKEITGKIVIDTKFIQFLWRISKGELSSALNKSLKQLGLAKVDLFKIQRSFHPKAIIIWLDIMSDAVSGGNSGQLGYPIIHFLKTR